MSDSPSIAQPSTYQFPPVAEAVIEIRFAQNVALDRFEQAAQRINQNYGMIEPEQHIDVNLDAATNKTVANARISGFRLASPNLENTAIIRENSLVFARLAPYTGWQELYTRAQADWLIWKKIIGPLKLARIGIRYVNRIDIPLNSETGIRLEEYFTVYPQAPENQITSLSNYFMQINAGTTEENFGILINTGSVPSPLINHASFALDLDLFRDISLPQRDDELWSMLSEMRIIKNRTFESCITDRTRRMFNA